MGRPAHQVGRRCALQPADGDHVAGRHSPGSRLRRRREERTKPQTRGGDRRRSPGYRRGGIAHGGSRQVPRRVRRTLHRSDPGGRTIRCLGSHAGAHRRLPGAVAVDPAQARQGDDLSLRRRTRCRGRYRAPADLCRAPVRGGVCRRRRGSARVHAVRDRCLRRGAGEMAHCPGYRSGQRARLHHSASPVATLSQPAGSMRRQVPDRRGDRRQGVCRPLRPHAGHVRGRRHATRRSAAGRRRDHRQRRLRAGDRAHSRRDCRGAAARRVDARLPGVPGHDRADGRHRRGVRQPGRHAGPLRDSLRSTAGRGGRQPDLAGRAIADGRPGSRRRGLVVAMYLPVFQLGTAFGG